MAQTLFDIYLTGRLAAGMTAADAAQRFAQLFRMPVETATGLISGKPQLIKRGVDEATGQKFREALQRAGLEVDVRPQTVAPAAPVAAAAAVQPEQSEQPEGLTLAPAGADMLTESERHTAAPVVVDTSHLKLAPQIFTPYVPGDTAPAAQQASIDAPDFTLAPAEGDLLQPDEKSQAPAMVPAVPDLTLAEAGALLETLPEEKELLAPDISGLSLAPAEGDLVKPEEKPEQAIPPLPDISHLRLRD